MKEKLDIASRLITFVYPILIFLGYYSYYSFYIQFDIDIFNYLSINELLFSFVSLSIPILIFIITAIFYLIFNFYLKPSEDNTINNNNLNEKTYLTPAQIRLNKIEENKKQNLSLIYNNAHIYIARYFNILIKKIKQKKYTRILFYITIILLNLIALFFKLFLWFSLFFFSISLFEILLFPQKSSLDYYTPFFNTPFRIIFFSIIWISMVFAMIDRKKKEKKEKITDKVTSLIQILILIIIVLSSITIYQKWNVNQIVNQKGRKISFLYNNEEIKSTPKLIYLGNTTNYIFLRDLDSGTNIIYSARDISKLEIKDKEY